MRERVPGAVIFVAAALVALPIVYLLVRDGAAALVSVAFGLLSMGLGWAGGYHLERRKRWWVLTMGVIGVLATAVPWVLALDAIKMWAVATGALSLVGLVVVARVKGP